MARVLLIRPDRNTDDAIALTNAGFDVQAEPWLRVQAVADAAPARQLAEACAHASQGDILVITSPRTWTHWVELVNDLEALITRGVDRGLTIMATGAATAETLPFNDVRCAAHASARGILAELAGATPATAFLPASAIAHPRLREGLEALGWATLAADVYDTVVVERRPASAADVEGGRFDAVVVRSPSAVAALQQHCPRGVAARVIAIGPSTSEAARALSRVTELDLTSPDELPAVVAAALAGNE